MSWNNTKVIFRRLMHGCLTLMITQEVSWNQYWFFLMGELLLIHGMAHSVSSSYLELLWNLTVLDKRMKKIMSIVLDGITVENILMWS
jgi:hypothetical protein